MTLIRIVKHSLLSFIYWFNFIVSEEKTFSCASEKRVIANILPLGKDLTLTNTDTTVTQQKKLTTHT